MAHIFKPPAPFALQPGTPGVFLAGSIDMGSAAAWQAVVEHAFWDADIAILNPRRDA